MIRRAMLLIRFRRLLRRIRGVKGAMSWGSRKGYHVAHAESLRNTGKLFVRVSASLLSSNMYNIPVHQQTITIA